MSWFPLLFSVGWGFFLSVLSTMEEVLGVFARKMALTDANSVEVVLPPSSAESKPTRFFMVGELFSCRPYLKESLISMLRGLWIPKNGSGDKSRLLVCPLEGSNRLLFSFKFEADLKWVVKGCPWSFERSLFAIAVTDGMVDPLTVSLATQFFWVRVYGLPPKLMDEVTGKCIGSTLGHYLQTGKDRQGSSLGSYLRI